MVSFQLSLLLIIALVAIVYTGDVNGQATPKVLGFFSNFNSASSFDKYADNIDIISMAACHSDLKGNIIGTIDTASLSKAKSKGIEVYVLIGNYAKGAFNPKIAHNVLTKPTVTAKFIQGTLDLVKANGFDGVDIDFEKVPKQDRAAYTSFMTELATELHNIGKKLMISVPPAGEDNPNNSGIGAFDYAALGKIVDIVQVMTYDQHGSWGKPGPVSGLDWVKKCINFAKSVIPVEKISMGMNAYGYFWNLDKKSSSYFSWVQFNQLIEDLDVPVLFDNKTSSPYIYYTKRGNDYVAWIENQESIKLKAQFAKEAGVSSISIWALRYEDQSYYDAINQGFAA